jgi:prepilin signal peptidase PulO-like enzyme (type II secretory pathway)
VNAAAAAFVVAPALALGSFLNVVVARVPAGRSIVRPPSSCASCGTEILWRDNVPLLAYALLRGRCRHCDVRISPAYPIVEALTALLVAACFAVWGVTAEAVLAAGFCSVLVVLATVDVNERIVPNRLVVPAAGFVLVAHTALDPSVKWLAWALVASGVLFLAGLANPTGLGMGDVKLALLLGAMLGPMVAAAVVLGLFAAIVPAALLVSRRGVSARKTTVPFVPFLSLGAVVALFFGDAIADAYVGFLLL